MDKRMTPVHQAVLAAIERGTPLNRAEIRSLKEKQERAVRLFKLLAFLLLGIFTVVLWIGIGLIDFLQVELPFRIPSAALLAVGAGTLLLSGLAIVAIRRRYGYLELLEGVEPGPKKSRASDAGKSYIEQARRDGRTFTRAEVEMLESSRDGDGDADGRD